MLDGPEPWARFVERGYYMNNFIRVMSSSCDIDQFMSIFKVSLSNISKSALSRFVSQNSEVVGTKPDRLRSLVG